MAGKRPAETNDSSDSSNGYNLSCKSKSAKLDICVAKEKVPMQVISNSLIQKELKLCIQLKSLDYGSQVSYVYDPIDYAEEVHQLYIRRFCQQEKQVLMLGMNPGPWGMCQTGVPFGHVGYVKDWLKISGNVKRPILEHPKKPIQGFSCKKQEVSGDRLWTLLKEISHGDSNLLFRYLFLHNYCPLAFLGPSSKNITPPELKKDKKKLEELCDEHLIEVVQLLNIKTIVGVGNYVVQRVTKALKSKELNNIKIVKLMHPSPINPQANKSWREIAINQLQEGGIIDLFKQTA